MFPSFFRSVIFSLLVVLALCPPLQAGADSGALRLLLAYDRFPPENAYSQALDPVLKEKFRTEKIETRTALYSEITRDLLSAFHVVLVMQEPSYGQSFLTKKNQDEYRKAVPLILEFVEKGGGLLITHDANFNPQTQDCGLINEVLLGPLGGALIPETVVDPASQVLHKERFTTMAYIVTTNITPHPITSGVKSVLVPVGPQSKVRDNVPIRTSGDWRILLRGNVSASSGGDGGENMPVTTPITYNTAPPLAAVRTFGKGRIFLFPQPARVWFHSAYHRELGGFVYRKGDGYRLVLQALRYLAEPTLARKSVSKLPDENTPHPAVPKKHRLSQTSVEALLKRPTPDSAFLGVIGLESSRGSVRDFAEAAKRSGLSFIAFADDMNASSDAQYARLIEDCRAVSNDTFLALPGIRYTSSAGLQFLALGLPHLPTWKDINMHPLGSHDVRALSRCMPYAPIYGHHAGGFPPYGLRFWDAIDVMACINGKIYDDSIDWYREITANMQEFIPIASQRVESPALLKKQTLWKTGVIAPRLKDIEKLLRQGNQKTFVTEGPLINQFSILNIDHAPLGARWYSTAFWKSGDQLALNIQVTSETPLRTVTLYWGKEIFRRFHPDNKEFKEIIRFTPSKDASFHLEAEDTSGRRVFSSPLLLRNFYKRFNWCTDQQNLICWNYSPKDDPHGRISPGRYGYNVSLNPGRGDVLEPNLPAHEVFDAPPGRELNMGGLAPKFSRIMTWPKFYGPERSEEILYQNRLVFCSEDAYVLDLEWNQDSRNPLTPKGPQLFEWKARLINPRGQPYEPNFWLIETSVKVLKDIQLGERSGPEIVLFEGICPPSLAEEWPRFLISGKSGNVSGATYFADPKKPSSAAVPLARHGYVALPSNAWFTPAFFALDDGDYVAHVGNASDTLGLAEPLNNGGAIQIGRELPNQVVPAGTVWKNRFLFVAAAGNATDEAALDNLSKAYGITGKETSLIKVRQGRLLSRVFDVQLEAAEEGAIATFEQAALPSCLLLQIQGLNPNWDAAVVDMTTGMWRRMGIYEITGLTTIRRDSPQELFFGHPYTANRPEVIINLKKCAKDQVEVEVHNPADQTVELILSSQRHLGSFFPPLHKKLTLAAGETRLVSQYR